MGAAAAGTGLHWPRCRIDGSLLKLPWGNAVAAGVCGPCSWAVVFAACVAVESWPAVNSAGGAGLACMRGRDRQSRICVARPRTILPLSAEVYLLFTVQQVLLPAVLAWGLREWRFGGEEKRPPQHGQSNTSRGQNDQSFQRHAC